MSSIETTRATGRASMTYTDETTGLTFAWSGGAYIDVTPPGYDAPTDCVNVYDYAAGQPTIATLSEFETTCVEWIAEAE